jgi:hypothetical protein
MCSAAEAGPIQCGIVFTGELQSEGVAAGETGDDARGTVIAAVAYTPEWEPTARTCRGAVPL